MKILMVAFISIMSWCSVDADLSGIMKALESGNANTVGTYMDDKVELAILDKEYNVTKSEAVKLLNDFYMKNKPGAFKQVHQGTSKGKDSQYSIANMVCGGKSYRVYVYVSNGTGKAMIQELRIDLD